MNIKRPSWWNHAERKANKKLAPVEQKPLPTVAEILSNTERHLPPSVTKDPGVTVNPSFMETTRTFTRRIRKYWNI